MKILVGIKRVIDYNVKIRVKTDQSGLDLNNAKMVINPFDEIALEAAVRIKEQGLASEVIAVSIGDSHCQESLRLALALGADKALHIETEANLTPLTIAKVFKAIYQQQQPQLILMGKQAIDDDCHQTGQMLAALLDRPQACSAAEITVEGSQVIVKREIDGGLETLAVELPAVITTDLRLNKPRYASLPNIMKAKQKPLICIPYDSLGIAIKPHFRLLKVSAPAPRHSGIKLSSVTELVNKLKNEAQVI